MIRIFFLAFPSLVLMLIISPTLGSDQGGARSSGLGGAAVTLDGFWSVLNNQAGLAGHSAFSAGVSAGRRFMLEETGTGAFGIVLPARAYVFGFSVRHSGYSAFRQMKAGLALARKFGDKISTGLQLDYLSTHIAEGYGRTMGVTFEAGFQAKLSDSFVIAAHFFNPLAIKYIDDNGEKPEGCYTVGIQYRFTEQLFICVEAEKDFRFKPVVRGGLEYEISSLAAVRIGYSSLSAPVHSPEFSQASFLSIGYGLALKNVRIEMSASWHTFVGWSPAVSFLYENGRAE